MAVVVGECSSTGSDDGEAVTGGVHVADPAATEDVPPPAAVALEPAGVQRPTVAPQPLSTTAAAVTTPATATRALGPFPIRAPALVRVGTDHRRRDACGARQSARRS